jgi:multidrug efflux pump subunit AcrB
MQTGLIMLIGLAVEDLYLLTEYASTRRHNGMSIAQAAMSAASVRSTTHYHDCTVHDNRMLALVFSTGAGANGNISLGVGVVGWHAVRHHHAAHHRTGNVHRLPDYRRTCHATKELS